MTFKIRHTRLALAALTLCSLPMIAQASPQTNVSEGMTLAGVPLAIHGYDPVAFFTENKAVLGQASHTAVHEGAAYRFASRENQEIFEKNPERYVPQYGGFCAYGAALGAKFDGDPRLFAIVNHKLYFNLNPDIQKKWNEDRTGYIRKAEKNWPTIRDEDPAKLGK